ncbi:MAG TPA: DUF4912 domain-containing protein [Verrucomicrobiota bacterium]|nr:DUF4912 domain-containing protein [Verrucomicrobiota bacterium]HNU52131.1 DUF4912 domain-containing protein [Verrucomicrobiota bacterium]
MKKKPAASGKPVRRTASAARVKAGAARLPAARVRVRGVTRATGGALERPAAVGAGSVRKARAVRPKAGVAARRAAGVRRSRGVRPPVSRSRIAERPAVRRRVVSALPVPSAVAVPGRVARAVLPPRPPARIPPLLLEGDASPAPAVSGPGERFVVGQAAAAVPAGAVPGLPESYGTQRLFLSVRDPQWLHAHWDLGEAEARLLAAQAAGGQLILRVYRGAAGTLPVSEIPLAAGARAWFLRIADGGGRYVAELGYWDPDGAWRRLALSDPVAVPEEPGPAEGPVEFATFPVDVPFSVILGKVEEVARENVPLVQMLSALRAAGFEDLPSVSEAQAGVWTPEQERALAAVLRVDPDRRVWVGSLDLTEAVRQRLAAEGGVPTGVGVPTSPAGGFGGPTSSEAIDSQGGVPSAAPGRRGFWFSVNAELIVYGATEPDATLTVGGRPVRLRADGTFSLRFALPDGDYALPLRAMSREGDDGREAALEFRRRTEYRGAVRVHPQDPALKAPRPEHAGEAGKSS